MSLIVFVVVVVVVVDDGDGDDDQSINQVLCNRTPSIKTKRSLQNNSDMLS